MDGTGVFKVGYGSGDMSIVEWEMCMGVVEDGSSRVCLHVERDAVAT